MLDLYAAVAPLTDAVDEIARGHFEVVPDDLREYFRDVHDHLRRASGRIAGFRELRGSALPRQPPRMNFEHMPELHWRFGYPAVLIVILIACALLSARKPGLDPCRGARPSPIAQREPTL